MDSRKAFREIMRTPEGAALAVSTASLQAGAELARKGAERPMSSLPTDSAEWRALDLASKRDTSGAEARNVISGLE